MKRKALGRGLSALLSETPVEPIDQKTIQEISIDSIISNRNQPRTHFDDDSLQELSFSIQTHGILQPLLVRHHPDNPDVFQLLAGERRLRAATLAELSTVPCIILEAEETKSLEIALVENIQREDLSPVEEAKGYKHLIDRFSLTQDEVSSRVGKSRETIANMLRLLTLPDEILVALESKAISVGHAKALLALKDSDSLFPLFERIMEENLSVREVEQAVREITNPTRKDTKGTQKTKPVDIHINALEKGLENAFQTKVRVKMRGKSKGVVEVTFYDLDQLDSLLNRWKVKI